MVSRVFKLFLRGSSGKGDLKDGEESFVMDSDESFLGGFIDINNFSFGHMHDLVKTLNFSSDDLCDPESFFHESFSGLDCDEAFAFTKEKSESA